MTVHYPNAAPIIGKRKIDSTIIIIINGKFTCAFAYHSDVTFVTGLLDIDVTSVLDQWADDKNMNDHNHKCQLDPSKCTQCPGDNLKGHIDSCHLLYLVANTIRQCGISRAGKEVESNGSLTFHNRSGHIIVLLSNSNSSLSLKDRWGQSPYVPGSEDYSALPPR